MKAATDRGRAVERNALAGVRRSEVRTWLANVTAIATRTSTAKLE
jgi:hypothetical protein